MGKYIKVFNNHNNYNQFIMSGEAASPNVSYCIQKEEVHYNPEIFANEYFTTIARENGTISFNIRFDMGTDMITSISYSTDNGETWTTTVNTDNKTANLVIDVNVNNGDKVMWKGDATQLGCWSPNENVDDMVGSFFSSDCEFDAQGNIMSLLYGDDFKGETTIENDYIFACLFYDYNGVKTCKVVNAKNLSLPAITLTNNCYNSMFYHCTSLTTSPTLPATTLAECCYQQMFGVCTSLTSVPELPATTLANQCYQGMFQNCAGLTTAPKLPATTLTDDCYDGMFRECTSLTTAPELPATTLTRDCYYNMFQGCTSLTTAPELPATTLASYCYAGMFIGCTSLTTAPELPATTLASSCYGDMFRGCTNLTTAPELPATTLVSGCYKNMFYNCTNINYIKAMFTTTPSAVYTEKWVNGVAASGTFVKNTAATWTTTGVNGIPSGWTVQTASN